MSRATLPVAALAALLACDGPANQAPVISELAGPSAVRARDSVEYRCVARDPDGWPWYFEWGSETGRFPYNWLERVWWVAPDSSCRTRLWVVVSDDSGASAAETLDVRVLADTSLLAAWSGAVKRGGYAFWPDTLGPGYTIYGRLRADTAAMLLRIADSANFHRWRAGQTAEWLFDQLAHRATEFEVRLLRAGVHFILLDNTACTLDVEYDLQAFRRGP